MSDGRPDSHPLTLRLAYPLVWAFAYALMTALGPIRFRGRYRVPKFGGLLIVANHRADIDPVVVQLACPRLIHFMGKSELFEMPSISWFIRWFRAFPVRRGEPDMQALKRAIALLKAGECVAIFPEGQLTEDGELQPLLPGAALIARQAGVPVLCCGLAGTERVLPYGSLVPRPAFRWVTASWGEARTFTKGSSSDEVLGWMEGQLRSLSE